MAPELGSLASTTACDVGALAAHALVRELELTPKPGLVDRENAGAHRDMDAGTLRASIAAISPWFPVFFAGGLDGCTADPAVALDRARADGLACERAMFGATGDVNTHKGGIFSLGLLCAAAGRLHGRGEALEVDALCAEVSSLTAGLVQRELGRVHDARTAGERIFRAHGFTGARGEAQAGFPTARRYGLPAYLRHRRRGDGDERALLEALVALMAHNADTNVVSRGGLDGLAYVQAEARALLAGRDLPTAQREAQLRDLDRRLIERNLSPGGSADLLAVGWFLAHVGPTAGDAGRQRAGTPLASPIGRRIGATRHPS